MTDKLLGDLHPKSENSSVAQTGHDMQAQLEQSLAGQVAQNVHAQTETLGQNMHGARRH
jgi:hypothetical protein